MYTYLATVVNVVDGDTFDMDIDLGFHLHIHERVRLLDVDTPEKFGAEKELGLICKKYAEQLLLGKQVIITSYKNETKTDSFGRWLAAVYVDDKSVCEIYNSLGINKYKLAEYSEDNVRRLNADE